MSKKILFIIPILLFTMNVKGQDLSIISGTVYNEQNEAVEGIHIRLNGTELGAASNSKGHFQIDHIPPDSYEIIISGVGYKTQTRKILLSKGESEEIEIILSKAEEFLKDITINSRKINRYSETRSSFVAKVPINEMDNPQVYSTISSSLMTDQVITEFEDALTNAPGIFKLWESTGRGGDGSGYYSLRGFAVQPTMANGLPSLSNGSPDPSNIERIEVIKGPSGTLFGSSLISYGGLINVVTKKPYHVFGGNVSYKTGSFGLNRITADINTPIKADDSVALRVNSAFHTQSSFQDAGYSNSFFLSPSLSYKVSPDLSFLIRTEFYQSESTNPMMLFLNRSSQLLANDLGELNYDHEQSYTSNDLTIKNPTLNIQAQTLYKINENWQSQTVLSRSSAKTDGYYTYLWDIADGNSTFVRYLSKQNSTTLGTDVQQNFIGEFQLGGIGNKMVAGLDLFQQKVINNNTGYVGFGQVTIGGETNASAISRAAADAALASTAIINSTMQQNIYSAYISNVFEFTPAISAMASLRLDYFDSEGNTSTNADDFHQAALSPKFGVIYQPVIDQVSFFANYMNGFSNVAPRVQDDGSTKNFSPEQANQWEGGIKTNIADGRITATLSYYNITVSNVVRQDPNRVNYYIQDGENFSKGIEAQITASPFNGLDLTAGFSHNISEITKTDSDEYRGRRPEWAGPATLINGWLSYRIESGSFQGLGVGFGGNYAGENMIMNRVSTGIFTLPAYTILDASLSYNTSSYRIDLKVNNVSNQEYYTGWSTINPQQPRSITASIAYKF